MRIMRDYALGWPALCLLIILGCDRRNRDSPTPAILSNMYFDAVVTCNGTKLPQAEFSVPPCVSFVLDAEFRSQRTTSTIGCIVTLLDDGSKHILNSCGGIAKNEGGKYFFDCELESPRHSRERCIMEIRDSNGELIFTAPLTIDP